MRILRIQDTLQRTGATRTPLYEDVANGLFTKPVKVGGRRAAGWPEREVEAIVAARVAGAPDEEVRRLVQALHRDRRHAYATAVEHCLSEVGDLRDWLSQSEAA
jgi:prophage regulatory protein